MKDIKITQITSKEHEKLPKQTMAFTDDIEEALVRIKSDKMAERLHSRGLEIVRPYNVFRIKYGDKTPYYQLRFEIRGRG